MPHARLVCVGIRRRNYVLQLLVPQFRLELALISEENWWHPLPGLLFRGGESKWRSAASFAARVLIVDLGCESHA